tara:strand:+ start:9967 stop:11376 length:1410 start_codon:yes stop_codon:yes gene_type:complete
MAERWERCRDAANGLDAVRKGKSKYLPMLSGQDRDEYNAYLKRADFYGALGSSVQAHVGQVFRKPPKIEVPAAAEDWMDDITLTGVSLRALMQEAYSELDEVGRYGLYVDMAPEEAQGAALRPYMVLCRAESVVSWRTENRDGKQVLNRVVIREEVDEEDPDDPFVIVQSLQYRVLELVGESYSVTLYTKPKGSEEFLPAGPPISPTKRGQPFGRIPFWFGNASGMTTRVDRPPLMDVADISLSIWRNSADIENGFHYVGIPTPWVAGFPTTTKLRIGSNVAWVSDKSDAKAAMLEFSGQGLNGLADHIERKKKDCAIFGSRVLEGQKAAAETADAVRLRHSGETASLVTMVDTLDNTFSEALGFLLDWGGITGESLVAANRDLLNVKATPQELQALTAAVQAGTMSYGTYYHNLEQLELTRPGVDAEQEEAELEESANREVVLSVQSGRPASDDEEARAAALASEQAA